MKAIEWTDWDGEGREHCVVWERGGAIHVEGMVRGEGPAGLFAARYAIECDEAWRTRSLEVRSVTGPRLHIVRDDDGNWTDRVLDRPLPSLWRIEDVALAMTPFTLTLPIRRLGMMAMEPGDADEPRCVRVPFPGRHPVKPWRAEPGQQSLGCLEHREAGRLFEFHGFMGDPEIELEVDADGFVIDWPSRFRRVRNG